MPCPPGSTNSRGNATRQRITLALEGAGRAGITSRDLAELVGVSDSTLWHYLPHMPVAVQASTRRMVDRRWFHARFAAAAQAHVERCDATPRVSSGPSLATRQAVLQHIIDSRAAGITLAGLALRTGLSTCTLHIITGWACRDQGVHKLRRRNEVRYYGPGVDMAAATRARYATVPAGPSPQQRLAKQRGVEGNPRPTRHLAGPSKPCSTPAASVAHGLDGLVLKPGAKVVVVTHQDPRAAAAATAQPLFGALRPGRYLDHDSAIARAYGPRPQHTAGR